MARLPAAHRMPGLIALQAGSPHAHSLLYEPLAVRPHCCRSLTEVQAVRCRSMLQPQLSSLQCVCETQTADQA